MGLVSHLICVHLHSRLIKFKKIVFVLIEEILHGDLKAGSDCLRAGQPFFREWTYWGKGSVCWAPPRAGNISFNKYLLNSSMKSPWLMFPFTKCFSAFPSTGSGFSVQRVCNCWHWGLYWKLKESSLFIDVLTTLWGSGFSRKYVAHVCQDFIFVRV